MIFTGVGVKAIAEVGVEAGVGLSETLFARFDKNKTRTSAITKGIRNRIFFMSYILREIGRNLNLNGIILESLRSFGSLNMDITVTVIIGRLRHVQIARLPYTEFSSRSGAC